MGINYFRERVTDSTMIRAWYGLIDEKDGKVIALQGVKAMVQALMDPDDARPGTQPDLRAIALEAGLFTCGEEYDRTLREVSLELVQRQLETRAGAEARALQMIEALDDLHTAINLLEERLYEASRLDRGDRLRGAALAETLVGDTFLGPLAGAVNDLLLRRKELQKLVEDGTVKLAPNLSRLAGSLLAARLISRAGGLKGLARTPASTIQVMGADKSLWKHLRGQAPSPKHGLIYRHPAVARAPRWARGRVSRSLAAKLALAARIDHESGTLNPELMESWERRLQAILNQRPKQ